MLFLLKRTWRGGLAGLVVLLLLTLGLRPVVGGGAPLTPSFSAFGLGLAVWAGVLVSDALVHRFLQWAGGVAYRQRFEELVGVFRRQSWGAMVAGSLMAGLGEEPLFRGLTTDPLALAGLAVLFGALHHIRGRLWPFTLWAVYEGLLFAAALYLTGNLFVTMLAHFLHDLAGFLMFRSACRRIRQRPAA